MQEMERRSEFSHESVPPRRAFAIEPDARSLDRRRRETLARVLETEIIPRLMLAHRHAPARAVAQAGVLRPADPERLVRLLLNGQRDGARAFVEARLGGGATENAVMVQDLGPAARKLGALWENDECDFVEVALALRALQDLLRAMSPDDLMSTQTASPSILLMLAPGETHALGADMVERFFRSSGWSAERASASTFAARLAEANFHAIGLSVSCERFLEPLRLAIVEAREVSRNRALTVLVGGAIFASNPELAGELGADFCAADANAAVQLTRTLLHAAAL